jgi:MFS family permease
MSVGVFCSGAASPAAWAATMDVSGESTSLVVGAMNMASTLGAFVMPVVLGYLIGNIQSTGGDWNWIIYFVAAVYLAGSLSWLAVNPETRLSPKAAS